MSTFIRCAGNSINSTHKGEEDGGNVASARADQPLRYNESSHGIRFHSDYSSQSLEMILTVRKQSYFEVLIVNAGVKSFVAIGLSPEDYDFDTEMPGITESDYSNHLFRYSHTSIRMGARILWLS